MDCSKIIGNFPAVLNFNRLFLKLNRFSPIIGRGWEACLYAIIPSLSLYLSLFVDASGHKDLCRHPCSNRALLDSVIWASWKPGHSHFQERNHLGMCAYLQPSCLTHVCNRSSSKSSQRKLEPDGRENTKHNFKSHHLSILNVYTNMCN